MAVGSTSESLTYRRRPVCGVCDDPAVARSPTSTAALPVCSDAGCRVVAGNQTSMSDEQFRHYLSLQRRLVRSRRSAMKHWEELKQAKFAVEAAEEDVWREHLRKLESVSSRENLLWVNIPSGPRQSLALSEERRQNLAAHLSAITTEACTTAATAPISASKTTSEATPDPLIRQLCSMCRGGCCTGGGNTAYLSAATIHRVLSAQPDVDSQQLREQYLNLVPDESMADSCIYHTHQGCALPREIRSDICNDFLCESLSALPKLPADANARHPAAVVLQRRQNNGAKHHPRLPNDIVAAALITDAGAVPLSPLPAVEPIDLCSHELTSSTDDEATSPDVEPGAAEMTSPV